MAFLAPFHIIRRHQLSYGVPPAGTRVESTLIPSNRAEVKPLCHDSHQKSERGLFRRQSAPALLRPPNAPGKQSEPFDERFRRLYVAQFRLYLHEVAVILLSGFLGERPLGRFELPI